ncbi:MAG: hypothetical protein JXQ87_14675 [Bacteroidia bacterium]
MKRLFFILAILTISALGVRAQDTLTVEILNSEDYGGKYNCYLSENEVLFCIGDTLQILPISESEYEQAYVMVGTGLVESLDKYDAYEKVVITRFVSSGHKKVKDKWVSVFTKSVKDKRTIVITLEKALAAKEISEPGKFVQKETKKKKKKKKG